MIGARFCVNSDLEVVWVVTDEEIAQNALTFIQRESQQPVAQQLQDISGSMLGMRFKPLLDAAEAARAAEIDRAAGADRFKTAYAEVTLLLDKAIVKLCAEYVDDLAQMGAYELQVKNGPRSLRVLKPTDQAGMIKFMNRYVELQSALPPAEKITNPPLSRMVELAAIINEGLSARDAGRTARRTNVRARVEGAQELLELLQVACLTLIFTRCGGEISPDLANWGYKVVGKSAKPKPIEPPQPNNLPVSA